MTTSAPDRSSLLAPITIGLRTDLDPTDVLASAWSAAVNSVPITQPQRNILVQDGKRRVSKPVRHITTVMAGDSDQYPRLARLCHELPDTRAQERWANWVWKAGARIVTDDISIVAGGRATLRLDITGYRLRGGLVESAAELALFRHYLATGIQAIDPDADITGHTEWDDNWWQLTS